MATKTWIFLRSLIHFGSGPANLILYLMIAGITEMVLEPGTIWTQIVALFLLTLAALFLTWADCMKLYIEPRLGQEIPTAGKRLRLRQHWWRFLSAQRQIRRSVYPTVEREHEEAGFLAATHLAWGLCLSFIIFWVAAPRELHLKLYCLVAMITSFGDPLAAMFGRAGSQLGVNAPLPLVRNENKTFIGSLAFALTAFAFAASAFMNGPLGNATTHRLAVTVTVTLAMTAAEALSDDRGFRRVRLDDNFSMIIAGTLAAIIWIHK